MTTKQKMVKENYSKSSQQGLFSTILLCFSCLIVGLLVGKFLYSDTDEQILDSQRPLGYADNKQDMECLWLVIWINFDTIKDRDVFLEWWQPLAQYVAENEPGLLSYEIAISDLEPLQILVFERYVNRAYLEGVHQKSDAYWKFKNIVNQSSFNIVKQGMSYIETDLGFIG
eukprot:TRINITY_DN12246_c0_g1_i18.p2 TRINITY_DN12246_c0_g1~~TRINITY_DN12246_c0_g1_i18.p2  ORF type:complete len:171 (+),score=5.61 TRINITY_DN12246_c0_g1_i18:72-584(+)